MGYMTGSDRTQAVLFPQSLDEIIDGDNEVRLIDLFVESLDLAAFRFNLKGSAEGRPAYHPKDLLKLYVYGYLNSIRSSRALEKECLRNIEVMWLLHQLVPDHNTISNFRRDNEKAIRKVFRQTVSIAKDFALIGGKLMPVTAPNSGPKTQRRTILTPTRSPSTYSTSKEDWMTTTRLWSSQMTKEVKKLSRSKLRSIMREKINTMS